MHADHPQNLVSFPRRFAIKKSEVALRNDAIRLARALISGTGHSCPKVAYLAFDAYRKFSVRYAGKTLVEQLITSTHYTKEAVEYYLKKHRLPVSLAEHTGDVTIQGDSIWLPVVYEISRKRT